MRLTQLLAELPPELAARPRDASAPDPALASIADDSRTVRPGALFVARAGAKSDGRTFVADAIARGAVAIVSDAALELPDAARGRVALAIVPDSARAAAHLAHAFHGRPTHTLKVIGVTGTNGKTTVSSLVQQILARAGARCGLIGTVETDDGRVRTTSSLTTPGALQLAETFARMVDHGCTHASMEVSSHALDQGRVAGVLFGCAIFTNLTGDHLDYHGSMERYADAKSALFRELAPDAHAIVNADDPWSSRVTRTSARLLRCSIEGAAAEVKATIREASMDRMVLDLDGPFGSRRVALPLVGRHNAMNALEAAAAVWAMGVDADAIVDALERCEAPAGRLQPVSTQGEGFSVLVDYAHTDDALRNVLGALRPQVPHGGALRVVFGCGGDRDRTKRPRMAAIACAQADQVVITSDNPRTEDPLAIINDILAGVPDDARANVHVEPDRAEAIAWAVRAARPGDVVLIAGKGHEDYQIVGLEKRNFDDRQHAAQAVAARAGAIP